MPRIYSGTRPGECDHDEYTRLAVERVTAGKGVEDPSKERSVQLNDELQPIYVCPLQKCDYRKSIPQIESQRRPIRCICNQPAIYHPEKEIYAYAKLDGGCGVCFHELDTLTYARTEIARNESVRNESVDSAWCSLPKTARQICEKKGILKYRLFENFNFHGELVYECRRNNSCKKTNRDIMTPVIIHNGEEI